MFDPITWRVQDPFSGGLGDHGLTMLALIVLAFFSMLYYYKHDKKGIIKSLFFGLVDAWLTVVLITFFFIWMAFGPGQVLALFIIPSGSSLSYIVLLGGGFYMIFGRWIMLGRGLKDILYTLGVMVLYAPFIVFWKYVLGGTAFSAWAPNGITWFPISLWEVTLGLYMTFLYYVVVVRRLG